MRTRRRKIIKGRISLIKVEGMLRGRIINIVGNGFSRSASENLLILHNMNRKISFYPLLILMWAFISSKANQP